MTFVRYLKNTHDAFAGEKRAIRGDHALILQLAGFVEILNTVEKTPKAPKRKAFVRSSADVQLSTPETSGDAGAEGATLA
jgi:hypothetical protein